MSLKQRLVATYGDPGTGPRPARAWAREHLVTCHERGDRPPLPGQPPGRWVTVHRLAEPSLRAALCEAVRQTGYQPQRMGVHVHRRMRHNPSAPLSLHAYGCAVDFDPGRNLPRRFRPGARPEPFGRAWRLLWPDGLSESWVAAFEAAGWQWGGRWRRYCDPMHFQLISPT